MGDEYTAEPKMTYYARVLDNETNTQVFDYVFANKAAWYYGKVDALNGGESEFVVEFDIWNNEPAFKAHDHDLNNSDATNCRLTVWPDINCTFSNSPLFLMSDPFMYARCTTFNYRENFTPIKYNVMLTGITGNLNTKINGMIQGTGDHARVETKIILPKNSNLSTDRYSFVFAFYYDYE